jgi:uncharacterized protein involved in exopolysaccharide biosynthesis
MPSYISNAFENEQHAVTRFERSASSVLSVHEVLDILSRRRRVAIAVFLLVCGGMILFGWILSDRYEARMEILVEQAQLRRADPVMTSQANDQPIVNQQSTREETINSEIAILTSQDVLRQVVELCGLDAKVSSWHLRFHRTTQEERSARAIDTLANKLRVEVLKMSDVIAVSYRSNDPQMAAKVLKSLGEVYLYEHALAHHPPGEFEFFQKETDKARTRLDRVEGNLVEFTRVGGVASGEIQLAAALRRLDETQALRGDVQTQIASTIRRIATLEGEEKRMPPRQTTQVRSMDNGVLLQQLKASLLNLRLKRIELLTKYQPTYPLVAEVDKEIAEAQDALADAEHSQVQEKTTDRDPNYELVREDLTRLQGELAGLQARSVSLAKEAAVYQEKARWLQQQGLQQADLMRNAKAAEDDYLLLLHKEEEARISGELDKTRIFNVSIVQTPSVPALPVHSPGRYLLYCAFLGLVCGFLTAVAADRLDPTLRTQDEAESIMGAPMLVALPLQSKDMPPLSSGDLDASGSNSRRPFLRLWLARSNAKDDSLSS